MEDMAPLLKGGEDHSNIKQGVKSTEKLWG